MTEFRCLVVSPEGRRDWRRVEARDRDSAASAIVSSGATPIEIRSGTISLGERFNRPVSFGRSVSLGEQALILTQLATLIRSGLPVDRSLDLLREQMPRARQRDLLAGALGDVRQGSGLAMALERTAALPAYAIGVIRAAERGGRLGDAITSVAARLTAASATQRQLVTALTYPAAVLAATVIALVLILTTVVPQFAPVFAGEEERLPGLTRFVLALSSNVREVGGALLLSVGAVIGGLTLWLRSPSRAAFPRSWRSRIPGLSLRDQHLSSQCTGVLATLLANGVPVVRALPLVRDALPKGSWRAYLDGAERRVREGQRLSFALSHEPLLPRTAIRLIEVGETSGSLAETCAKASMIMGEAARARLDRVVSLANPIAIVLLGAIVAGLVGGVMLGIFALGDFAG